MKVGMETKINDKLWHDELFSQYISEEIMQNNLTEREIMTYNMRINGATYKEIAAKIGMSSVRALQIYGKVKRKLKYLLKWNVHFALIGLSKIDSCKSFTISHEFTKSSSLLEETIVIRKDK